MENVVLENRKRDVYLRDGDSVVFIPQGWCDEWSYAAGHTGGLDWTPEHGDMADGPEIYCYAPVGTCADSESETLFVSVAHLATLSEVTEVEAQQINPKLFRYLEAINRAEV